MPMRVINPADSPALEARDSGQFGGPDYDLSEYGVELVQDLNAARHVVQQSDYSKHSAEVRAEIDKVVFLQIRRKRAEEERERGES